MDRRQRVRTSILIVLLLLGAGCDRFTSDETRLARATAALEQRKYQAALIDLRKILDSKPNDTQAQLLLVDVLTISGETQAAREELDRLVAADAPASATEIRSLKLYATTGNREGLRNALAASTTLPAPQRAAFEGRLLLLDKKPAEAQAAFERGLADEAGNEDAAIGRVEAIAAQGRASEALQAVDALLARTPEWGRAWMLKASLAWSGGDFAESARAFSSAIEHPRGLSQAEIVQAHAQRVESYLAAGNVQEARTALASLNDIAGESVIASFTRAKVALAERDATTAVNELRKFTQAMPQYVPGRLLLAAALLEQGSTEQAYAEAQRSAAEFSQSDEPKLALADIQLRLGRTDDAEETLDPLVTRSPPNPLAAAMLAQARIRRGEIGPAIALLEQSVKDQPRDSRLRLQLAAGYLSGGSPRRALETLDSVDDPNLAGARDRIRVIATAATRGWAEAQKELEAALAKHPDDVELLLMAAYRASTGNVERARGYLQKARALRPDDSTLTIMLARFETSAGHIDEADKLVQAILEKRPNDIAAMMLMADIAAYRGKQADVDAWLNRARIANPNAMQVQLALAQRAAARGNSKEARNILIEAVRNGSRDPAPRIALAELDASTGRYADALESLRQAAKDRPGAAISVAMARVQLAMRDTAAARKSLQDALTLSPGFVPAATTLAALEMSAGNLPAALDLVRQVRKFDPEGASSYTLEGDVLTAAKRPADAAAAFIAGYRRAPGALLATRAAQAKVAAKIPSPEAELTDWVAREPGDALARRTLAEYLIGAGKTDAAIGELEKVVAARPQDLAALNNLAWLYHQKNDQRALGIAEKAYTGAPKVAAVADTYGWILAQSGGAEKAVAVLGQAAELAPDDPQIQYHYAYAASQSGERDRAVQILKKLVGSGDPFPSRREAQELLRRLAQN
jgi:putative PEP-CTERM system TPR-repeat lipoprotein